MGQSHHNNFFGIEKSKIMAVASKRIYLFFWFTLAGMASAQSPSPVPSPIPTMSVTYNTSAPTASPSLPPTATPTLPPSFSPTMSPTAERTPDPTLLPSLAPTAIPTLAPSPLPTVLPSNLPTVLPTLTPTPLPTIFPTHLPTALPTARPSRYPTAIPTPSPSPLPTPIPSPSPTQHPIALPTGAPTPMPFPVPTRVPIPAPSGHPTPIPTPRPTIIPTPQPSQLPTILPTPTPTHEPTPIPTQERKTEFPVLMVVASVSSVVGVVLIALIIRNTDCISKITIKTPLVVGDKVKWWSQDADIPLGAVGEILSINEQGTKAKVKFQTGEFELGLQTLKRKKKRNEGPSLIQICMLLIRGEADDIDNSFDNGNESLPKDESPSKTDQQTTVSKERNKKNLEPDEEIGVERKFERKPSWTPKNYSNDEYERMGDAQQGLTRKLSFTDKQRAKATRSFTEFLGRGHLQHFAPRLIDLGYLDVKSFVGEVDQSLDSDLRRMLDMTSEELESLRKLCTLFNSLFDKNNTKDSTDSSTSSVARVQTITQTLDRSLSFRGASMALEMNQIIPTALDEVVRGSLSRPSENYQPGASIARQGSLTRQGSMQRSNSFTRDGSFNSDEPGSPLTPDGGRSALLVRANSLIRSESIKRNSDPGDDAGGGGGPVRRPSGVGSNLRRPSNAPQDMDLLTRASSLIRGESNVRVNEPPSPSYRGSRRNSEGLSPPASPKPPSSQPRQFKRMNSKTRNSDQDNREEAIQSLRLSESSMSFNFFGGGESSEQPQEEPQPEVIPKVNKSQRRRSRGGGEPPSTPKSPTIQEETSTSSFMTPLNIFDSGAVSSQFERSDGLRNSFTDFFSTSAEPKDSDSSENTQTKSAKSSSSTSNQGAAAQSKSEGGGGSRLAEAKMRRANSLTVDTGRSGGGGGDNGEPTSSTQPNSTRKLSTLQKHQEIIARQHKAQQNMKTSNSPRTPVTPGTSI